MKDDVVLSPSSSVFKRLQWTFLTAYLLAGAGDNIQGSYRYALYDSYGISRSTIELFYVASYGSSLFIGTFVTPLADRFGRRLACLLCGFLYIIACTLINISLIWVLVIGSIFWGTANAFYNTGFEAWIIQEHHDRLLDNESLKRILRNAYAYSALTSVLMGFLAQLLVVLASYSAPFNMASVCFLLMIIFIWNFWPENYGNKEAKATTSFVSAIHVLRADPRIVLLGFCSALFDAALYIFVIEWTPTVKAANNASGNRPLLFGLIFAGFMLFDMLGAFTFKLLVQRIRPQSYIIVICLLAGLLLIVPVILPQSLVSVLVSFTLYEFCVGLFRPSMALLRSLYVPNEVRATIMTYFRIPQIILMLIILLSHFPLSIIFILSASFNFVAMLCMITLRSLKLPEEKAHVGEAQILLDEPTSPLFELKRPQIRSSSSASLVPQNSIKSEVDY